MNITKKSLIYDFFTQNRLLIFLTMLIGVLEGILTIFIPISVTHFLEFLSDYASYRVRYFLPIPEPIKTNFYAYVIFFLTIIIFRAVFSFLFRFQRAKIGELFSLSLKKKVFEHQIYTDYKKYEEKGVGKYLLRYSGDLGSIQNYLTVGIIRFSRDMLVLVLAFILMSFIHVYLGIIFIIAFIIAFVLLFFPAKKVYEISEKRRNYKASLLSFVSKKLIAIKTIRIFNREIPEINSYNSKAQKIYQEGIRYFKWYAAIMSAVPFVLYLIILIIFIFLYEYNEVNLMKIDSKTVVLVILLFISIIPICRRLLNIHPTWKKGNISFKKLIAIFSLPLQQSGEKSIKIKKGIVVFKDVKLFNNLISFEIKGNGFYHLKTNNNYSVKFLVQLFLGLQKIEKGTIEIDGKNQSSIDGKSWRRTMSLVSEDTYLLGKSVADAILYSKKSEKLQLANEYLNLLQKNIPKENIINLEDKIGENAIFLKPEQKKILHYLRAFLTQKRIILIEYPFDNIDTIIKNNIIQFLNIKRENHIIILISNKTINEIENIKVIDI